jgi:hypothetical protein
LGSTHGTNPRKHIAKRAITTALSHQLNGVARGDSPVAGSPAGGNLLGMDAETVRAMLIRNLGREAEDPVGSHAMYADDAVLEFPQSGERFEGVGNIREWRSRNPGSVSFDIQRIRGAGDVWVAEMTVRYDDGEPHYGVDVLEISDGKIVRETVYVGEPFDPPEWRAPWRAAG